MKVWSAFSAGLAWPEFILLAKYKLLLSWMSWLLASPNSDLQHLRAMTSSISEQWPPATPTSDFQHLWALTSSISEHWPPASLSTDLQHLWALTSSISEHWPPASLSIDLQHLWALTSSISEHWPPASLSTDLQHLWAVTRITRSDIQNLKQWHSEYGALTFNISSTELQYLEHCPAASQELTSRNPSSDFQIFRFWISTCIVDI